MKTVEVPDDAHEADMGERCPNKWKCSVKCLCHRLSDEELAADLAAHFRVRGLVWYEGSPP